MVLRAMKESSVEPASLNPEVPEAEALLKAIVDSSDDAIISKDLHSIVTSWNASAERVFGYTASEMIGRSITTLIPDELNSQEEEIMRKIRGGERIDHFETKRKRKDGRLIDVVVSISPVYSRSGKVVGASKVARDISEAKRMVQADELLAAIVNSSDDAIISKTLDGIITSWNLGAERIFGYTASEIVGQSVMMLIPHERKNEEPKILDRLRAGERVDHFETVRLRKNGEEVEVSLTISPIKNGKGRIVGASKIARDIAGAKKLMRERENLLESERAARSQAEQTNRMKDEFLATVSHELRTPLNAIVGWTEVLADGVKDQNEVVFAADVIKKSAFIQAQLIDDLLDLGRISSGKMMLQIDEIDLPTIIRDAVASVQHAADAKRIILRILPGDLPAKLAGDSRRLQQIIWNLVSNAIKFTDNGGRVTISANRVGSLVEIIVMDNGRGIAPSFLPYLFERFRQADSSITRRSGGLGIGLALVKQLVELHGGTVVAESAGLGHGATFKVGLPIPSVPENHMAGSPNLPESTQESLAGLKVFMVDDDSNSLEVVKRVLSNRKAEVQTANSVTEALALLRTFSPDVILSDISMPELDGYQFVRKLRENPSLAGIPAVALTAMSRSEDRTAALNAGFQAYIVKPIPAAELVAVVRSLAALCMKPAPVKNARE